MIPGKVFVWEKFFKDRFLKKEYLELEQIAYVNAKSNHRMFTSVNETANLIPR
jgi:hypothetical protein